MKTFRFNTPAAWMLVGLSALMAADSTRADKPGTARLTDLPDATIDNPTDSSPSIIRGQSDLRRRNAQSAQALRQFFRDEAVQPAGLFTTSAQNRGCCPGFTDNCCPNACDGCDASGKYRISSCCPACGGRGCDACQNGCGNGSNGCPMCNSTSCLNKCCLAGCLSRQAAAHRARNRLASRNLNTYLRCKLGYFIHDGSGGVGSPLFGHYKVVYPVNPSYADARDGQVYAAQGYGGPVSVPLAPTVRHAHNYGWGMPSSRLTPVSNPSIP